MAYQAPCWLLFPFAPEKRQECLEENTRRLLEGKKEVQITVAEERTERVEYGGGFWQNLDDAISATGDAIGAAAGTTPFAGMFQTTTTAAPPVAGSGSDESIDPTLLIGGATLAAFLLLRS